MGQRRLASAKRCEVIAAIDIGTNSIHLAVARIGSSGHMTLLDTDKVQVRLGKSLDKNRNLPDEAVTRVVEVLNNFKNLALSYTNRIRVVATYAVREARNQKQVLERLRTETELNVELIDGLEEARISYLGMKQGLVLHKVPILTVDVGGGSTDLAIGDKKKIRYMSSLKLGAVMLTKKFVRGNIPKSSEITAIQKSIVQRLAPLVGGVEKFAFDKAVVSSGTAKALAFMACVLKGNATEGNLNGYVLKTKNLSNLVKVLIQLRDPEIIAKKFRIDPKRAEIITAGALILRYLGKVFSVDHWYVSTYGLREGLIIDTYSRIHRRGLHFENVRWHSIVDFGRRVRIDAPHAFHVSRLAQDLYDQLAPHALQKYGKEEVDNFRELLKVAAYLHESGKFLGCQKYHFHSQYLIENSNLMGFNQEEKQFIGLLTLFHRKVPASGTTAQLNSLSGRYRSILSLLAGILRLATSLGRTRCRKIRSVRVDYSQKKTTFTIFFRGNMLPRAELAKLKAERSALEADLGFPIKFSLDPAWLEKHSKLAKAS